MQGIRDSLGAHHQYFETLLGQAIHAARLADWPAYRMRFSALRAALEQHISYEDQELFPELARLGGAGPAIEALREEHDGLRQQCEALGAAAPEHDPQGCMVELEQLGVLLRKHHARELHVCYPQSDELLGTDSMLTESARYIATELPLPEARVLDLRGLQPPEPIVRIFDALERAPREPLRAILPHEPVPLYNLLRERGFVFSGSSRADGGFEVLIEPGVTL